MLHQRLVRRDASVERGCPPSQHR